MCIRAYASRASKSIIGRGSNNHRLAIAVRGGSGEFVGGAFQHLPGSQVAQCSTVKHLEDTLPVMLALAKHP